MKHRTAIITAASIVVVIAAATAAVATNLGILDSATAASDVGTLSIETIETAPPTVAASVDTPSAEIVVIEDTSSSDSFTNGDLAAYAVGDAGIVTLNNDLAAAAVIVVTETVHEDDTSATNASAASDQEGSDSASSSSSYDDDDEEDEYEDDGEDD